jgi:hypothetical protein
VQGLEAADAVFDATVDGLEVFEGEVGRPELRTQFIVHASWKGVDRPTVQLRTDFFGPFCGYSFRLGERYVVYAHGALDDLSTSICSRTRPYSVEEAEALGAPLLVLGANEPWPAPEPIACPDCPAPREPAQAVEGSDAVFQGRLIGLSTGGPQDDWRVTAEFENLGWWKGAREARVTVDLAHPVWDCENDWAGMGKVIDPNVQPVIFADRDVDGQLYLKLCEPGRWLDAELAAALGPSQAPEPAQATETPGATETILPGPSSTPTPTVPDTPAPPPSPTCEAVYCGRPSQQLIKTSDLVFEGRAKAVQRLGAERGWGYEVEFEAERVWKGPVERGYVVMVSHSAWTCDQGFDVGKDYVVFARQRPDGGFDIPRCYGFPFDDPRAVLGDGVAAEPALAAGHFGGRIRVVVPAPGSPELAWVAQGPRVMAVDLGQDVPKPLSLGILLEDQVEALAVSGSEGLALAGGVLQRLELDDAERPTLISRMVLGDLGEFRGPIALFHTQDFGTLGFVVHASRGEPARVAAYDIVGGKLMTRDLIPNQGAVIDMIRAGDLLAVTTKIEGMDDGPARLHLLRPGLASIERFGSLDDVAMGRLAYAEVGGEARLYSGDGRSREVVALGIDDPDRPIEIQRWMDVTQESGENLLDLAVTRSGGVYLSVERRVASFYSAGYVLALEPPPDPMQSDEIYFSVRKLSARLVAAGEDLLLAGSVGLGRLDPVMRSLERMVGGVDMGDIEAGEQGGQARLFTASDSGGLAVYDAQDPLRPEAVADLEYGVWLDSLQVDEGLATIADFGWHDTHDNAIAIFDMDDLNGEPDRIGNIDLRNAPDADRYARSGDWLVARASADGSFRQDEIGLFDLSDPAAPLLRANLRLGGAIMDMDMAGRLVVVTHKNEARSQAAGQPISAMTVLWVEGEGETLALSRRGSVELGAEAAGDGAELPLVALDGGQAWVVVSRGCERNVWASIVAIDVGDPDRPGLAGPAWAYANLAAIPWDLQIAEGHAFLIGLGPVEVVDLRQPAWPRRVGDLGMVGMDVAVQARRVFVATGEDGVYILEPDLAWASDSTLPTPTPPPLPSVVPPTPTPDCRPTPTATPEGGDPTVTVTPGGPTATATGTGGPATMTPTRTPVPLEPEIYLPWLGKAAER